MSSKKKQLEDLEMSEINSFSTSVYDNLKNSLSNSSLFEEQEQEGGRRKKRSGSKRSGSKKALSKCKTSKRAGSKKKKGSKKSNSKRSSYNQKAGSKKKYGSKRSSSKHSGSKRKSSKRSGSKKTKRALPDKLKEFQILVKHLKTVVGEHSKFLFTLAKQVRDDITKSNPNISSQDLTKKAIKHVDDNKAKMIAKYKDLKK